VLDFKYSKVKRLLASGCSLFTVMFFPNSGKAETEKDRFAFEAGFSGVFDNEHNPTFIAEYTSGASWRGIHPWLMLSWATDGALFSGAGASYSIESPSKDWTLTGGWGPGYYERHQGADLGSHLEFCSYGEIGWNASWHQRLFLRFMHISNGGLIEPNPGNEIILLGYAVSIR
jgi:hypothetical protein